jgi:hypothetical protein
MPKDPSKAKRLIGRAKKQSHPLLAGRNVRDLEKLAKAAREPQAITAGAIARWMADSAEAFKRHLANDPTSRVTLDVEALRVALTNDDFSRAIDLLTHNDLFSLREQNPYIHQPAVSGGVPTAAIGSLKQQPLRDDRPIVEKVEGDLKKPLDAYLSEMHVPRKLWPKAATEIERLVRRLLAANTNRAKWDDRHEHAELSHLTAPEFLKTVWADVIGPDGSIEKDLVRQHDKRLMDEVVSYINIRRSRGRDAGRARGLKLLDSGPKPG